MDYLAKVTQTRTDKQSDNYKKELVGAFKDLATELKGLEKVGTKSLDKDFMNAVNKLSKLASDMEKVKVTSDQDIKTGLLVLIRAVQTLKVSPIVNVSPAKVEVIERDIDFSPLISAMSGKEKEAEDDYKAQDIDETDPNVQYIGFVNAEGCWYIIENNMINNSLRYKFGKDGYKEAMKNPANISYKLYNEAVNEA